MYTRQGYVYLLGSPEDPGVVKIGFSVNPTRRLKEIQRDNGHPLTLMGMLPGTRADEKAMHARFREHRKMGEWFYPTQELFSVFGVKEVVPA
jgi:hypothetical protein